MGGSGVYRRCGVYVVAVFVPGQPLGTARPYAAPLLIPVCAFVPSFRAFSTRKAA